MLSRHDLRVARLTDSHRYRHDIAHSLQQQVMRGAKIAIEENGCLLAGKNCTVGAGHLLCAAVNDARLGHTTHK